MATALLTKSHGRFMMPKILATINSSGQCSYLLAKSCRLFSDRQKNSNLSAVTPTVGDIVAAYKSLPVSPPENHRVFISFRGDQLRCNFYSHLIDAFDRHDIKFYEDKGEERGRDLEHIFVRIQESRIGLAFFSTRYSESKWCMNELVKMKKHAKEGKLKIIPIFFKVEASEVKKPTCESEFGRNFWRLMETSDQSDPIQEWREALESTSDKMGLCLKDKSSEADFVKEIVKEVERVNKAIRFEEENHGEIPEPIVKDKYEELQLSIREIPEFRSYKTIKR